MMSDDPPAVAAAQRGAEALPAAGSVRSEHMPAVVAVLVVCDGAEWLPAVLRTLARQRYARLDLVVVDNASRDGSADLLDRRIPSDRLIRLERSTGFARAMAAGLRHEAVATADLVLLVHDDLALAPDAVSQMVAAMEADPELAIVGPKLREWREEPILQQVGMTVDRFGRAESGLDRGELDQGQHDTRREVLYVSTAGMLVRAELLDRLGGFDQRMTVLRDDLDVSWRAWLAGYRVSVVPPAIGYHAAAGSRQLRRIGRGRHWESRYLSERHAIVAMLKNYSLLRLAWVLPVAIALTVVRIVAFVATRRFGAATAALRAYGWNLLQLGPTLRQRRAIQRQRVRSDAELSRLFAPGLPRVRDYSEALGSWLAGGGSRALLDDVDDPLVAGDHQDGSTTVRVVRDHPVVSVGLLLALVYLLGLIPLLGPGQLVGGEILPWPETARAFLRSYASPWNGEPAASPAFASPIQIILGFASFLGFGSAWLAQRLLVLGLVPLAWLTALRAGRIITFRPWPRLLGATLYALSAPVLGTLAQGRYGALVMAALLPALVLLAIRAVEDRSSNASAWRAAALLGLGLVVVVGAAPQLWLLPALLYGGALVGAVSRGRNRGLAFLRIGVGGAGAVAILAPWLVDLIRHGATAVSEAPQPGLSAWRGIGMTPDVLPGTGLPGAVITALATVAVAAAAVLLGRRRHSIEAVVLTAAAIVSALGAWLVGWLGPAWVWAPALLLPGALAVGGLGVVAARGLAQSLRGYEFGRRQLSMVVAASLVALGLAFAVGRLGVGPYAELERSPELIPPFVAADTERVGPYRVLLLSADEGSISWDLTLGAGPSMVAYGTVQSRGLLNHVGDAVAALAAGRPGAGDLLGLANIRYVVVQDAATASMIADMLLPQPALEPLPSGGGQVYRVRSWLPRAVVLDAPRAERLLTTGDPGNTADLELDGMQPIRPGSYTGVAPDDGGVLVVSEARSPLWHASSTDQDLAAVPVANQEWPLNAFRVPATAILVSAGAGSGVFHSALIAGQIAVAFLLFSLVLRPPRFGRRRVPAPVSGTLPADIDPQRADDGEAGTDDVSPGPPGEYPPLVGTPPHAEDESPVVDSEDGSTRDGETPGEDETPSKVGP